MKTSLLALLTLAATTGAQAQATAVSPPVTAVAAAPAASAARARAPKLDRAALDALLTHPEQLVLIDVRRPDEQTAIGAFPVFLSIQSKELEAGLAFIPRDRSVVTVSNHAARALAAADLLAARGFKVAGAVGVQDYEAQGGALVRIRPPATAAASAATATAATAAATLP